MKRRLKRFRLVRVFEWSLPATRRQGCLHGGATDDPGVSFGHWVIRVGGKEGVGLPKGR